MAARSIPGARSRTAPSARSWASTPASGWIREIARKLVGFGDGLAYSSGLVALTGGAMTWAAGRALASAHVPRDAVLVACGAFVIYNIDRLRDLARDGTGSPGRTGFVLRNRPWLVGATGIVGLVLAALLATAPAPSVALCLTIGATGLLHRRLKRDVRLKVVYVAAAWTAACVGLPGLARGGALGGGEVIAWSCLFVGSGVTANLIASNLRDGKRSAGGWTPERALFIARGVTIAALAVAGLAPESFAPLAWIPAAEAAVLCIFRGTERFGHLAVDGALLLGALIAIAHSSS